MGIRATLGRLSQQLRCQDEELWEHLERGVRINPQFYAFRQVRGAGRSAAREAGCVPPPTTQGHAWGRR